MTANIQIGLGSDGEPCGWKSSGHSIPSPLATCENTQAYHLTIGGPIAGPLCDNMAEPQRLQDACKAPSAFESWELSREKGKKMQETSEGFWSCWSLPCSTTLPPAPLGHQYH